MSQDTRPYEEIWPTLEVEHAEAAGHEETIALSANRYNETLRKRLPATPLGHLDDPDSQFSLRREIGRGGMGAVHLATQVALGRDVALKVANAGAAKDTEDALLQEARVMGLVEHPNVVPVHLMGVDQNERPIIVMKRVEGESWREQLGNEGILDPAELERHVRVLMDVCHAIAYAHSLGIIHRDLKPDNIMVGSFGEVYVLDWGLAATVGREIRGIPSAEVQNVVVGTPAYLAPEMTVADGSLLCRATDIYLLGGILYRICTGRPPHTGKKLFELLRSSYEGKPREYPAFVPEELRAICERAMALTPGERFESVEAMREALETFLSHTAARELIDEGQAQSERFYELAATDGDLAELYRVFGAARFAYERARSDWPESEEASAGLQRLVETMIERELEAENPKAARLLAIDLPEPRPDLEERIGELEHALAGRGAELEKLRELRRDVDVDVELRSKRNLIMLMGLGWLGLLGLYPLLEWMGLSVRDAFIAQSFLFLPVLLVMWVVGRDAFRANAVNLLMIRSFFLMWGAGATVRLATYLTENDLRFGTGMELLVFAVGVEILALSTDQRFHAPAGAFLASAIGVFVAPDLYKVMFCVAGILASLSYVVATVLIPPEGSGQSTGS